MALTEDEKMAGGLMNAAVNAFGEEAIEKAISEMSAREANDAHRAREIGEQMKQGRHR